LFDSLRLIGHFPGEPGLASLLKLRMMEMVVTTGAIKGAKLQAKKSPPTNQHPVFYKPDALPVAQPTVSVH